MPWRIEQYRTVRGDLPVEVYLERLPAREQAVVTRRIEFLAAEGLRLGEPLIKRLFDPQRRLYELRPAAQRIFFCARDGDRFVLLHAFRKRSNRTSPRDLTTAQRRYDEVVQGAGTAPIGWSP